MFNIFILLEFRQISCVVAQPCLFVEKNYWIEI